VRDDDVLPDSNEKETMKPSKIAIVGMAGRFPGARNVDRFWQNLREGVESIRTLSDAELLAAGVSADDVSRLDYVKRASVLDDVPMFDASFFGLSPRDAAIMDPQHRHFLECAWEALEDAGHPPQSFNGSVGVFAGSGMNTYLIHNLLRNRELLHSTGLFQLKQTGNDKDVLATRVSYQFDLRGPSINVQTACSTSLVAVHLACQSLLNHECDMVVAGGVTIEVPHGQGYIYREGEILSRDGHCRPFAAASTGTVFASGVGVVVLRRLEDALQDGDAIRAIILGSAINNDGARKVGYLAPSVEGQGEVIAEAMEFAGVSADDISYVEAHGTGTVVGDPIEIRALTRAFHRFTARSGYCAIGSLKSNVGHLDAAAGIAGLIKTVLALEHAQLPPSLHYQNPNPHIEFQGSPFFVNSTLADWPSNGSPRRAGVTSLGIGGTNAHVILEESLQLAVTSQTKPYQLFTVSAKTESALERASTNLIAYLAAHPEVNLADASFTCQVGRHSFPHRRAFVVDNTHESVRAIAKDDSQQFPSGLVTKRAPQIVLMFSGQGSQHVNMGRELYEHEPVFRESLDLCAKVLLEPLGIDLRRVLYPSSADEDSTASTLNQTWLTQPALFAIEYSLARWWISLGVEPAAMVGHSIGEYVAACLAGVFTLEDALTIVAFRGRLMHGLDAGAMLAVSLPEADVYLSGKLCLAAVNSPSQCVVSGPTAEIDALEHDFAKQTIACRRLITSHAFHSAMMDPILDAFEQRLRSIAFLPPRIPFLSNLTGTWIKPEEATDANYWARHMRHTVRFSDCLAELIRKPDRIFIETGPGNALTSFARELGGSTTKVFQSLPHPRESAGALRCALQTLGQVWTLGVSVDWMKLHKSESVRRLHLPTYPFEHRKFWIEPDRTQPATISNGASARLANDGDKISLYRQVWKPAPLINLKTSTEANCCVIFNDSLGLGEQIAATLRIAKQRVIIVEPGSSYCQSGEERYAIRPGVRSDYDALVADIFKSGHAPNKILHLWSVVPDRVSAALNEVEDRSFFSPLFLAQALASQDVADVNIALVSNHMQQIFEERVRNPVRAVLLGPARVIPIELPGIACRSVDVDFPAGHAEVSVAHIIAEMNSNSGDATIAFRSGQRFVETVEPLSLASAPQDLRLEAGGVYLITGGLGGLGLAVAEELAREFGACLVLTARQSPPPEAEWENSLSDASVSEAAKGTIRKLIEIRSAAGGLMVAQGDVTNLEQMRAVVSRATRQFGKIDGVFHAAGVLDDGPLMLKTAQSARCVLDPKVRGTLVLEAVLRDVPLRCFVLYSSISSIYPPPGQVDYAAANAFLDAFALSRKGPVTVVNWGAWRDVGMAAHSVSPHPLLQTHIVDTPHEIVYSSNLSERDHWILSDHKLRTDVGFKALMPGTGYLEMAAAAFSRGSSHGAVEFSDVFFLVPLMLDDDETREVRLQLKREMEAGPQSGAFRFSVLSSTGEHSTGFVGSCLSRPAALVDRMSIVARCHGREIIFDEQHRTRQERHLAFGPRWKSLRRLLIGKDEGLAEIELEEAYSADVRAFRIHPALLDLATGASLYLTEDYEHCNDLFLPISYRKLCIYHPLPTRLFSHMRSRQPQSQRSEIESFDITFFDEQGQVLAEVEGFSLRRIADPMKSLQESVLHHGISGSVREQPMEDFDLRGIRPMDGVRALIRILSVKTPHGVIAVSQPLSEMHRSKITPSRQTTGTVSIGSALATESMEETLIAWWRESLGVPQVNLDDDFFSLGGHSLVGVRLLAKIKKTFHVDLELAVLFEARTVRQLAHAIRKL
jgi:acyl transferase domain-containing protein/acyl carrier protein